MSIRGYFARRRTESVTLKEVEFEFFGVKGTWVADREQQTAAWEMYVELITRIAIQPLGADEGLLREALSSLYSLFGETRRILKQHGPRVAQPLKLEAGQVSFGILAVSVLNRVLRPFLARWHPLLLEYEQTKGTGVSSREHERSWSNHLELRRELDVVRSKLDRYADLLAQAAGIQKLHSP
jgi:hypothetical protein